MKWGGIVRELSLRELQLAELDLLKVFRQICEENGLYYTLAGGTLLGAVRHKGFIPWDDDIDVMMPRPDFERLLDKKTVDLSFLPDYVRLESWKDGGNMPFIKMRDKRTRMDYRYSHSDKEIWIDIFPADGCPDDDSELAKLFRRVIRRRKLLLLRIAKPGDGKTFLKKILKPFAIAALAPYPIQKFCEDYDRLVQTYDFEECSQIGGVCWGYGPGERIDKERYLTPVELEFEGEMFKCPSNYDQYLEGLYGDYMVLPPPEKRTTRHDMKVYFKE